MGGGQPRQPRRLLEEDAISIAEAAPRDLDLGLELYQVADQTTLADAYGLRSPGDLGLRRSIGFESRMKLTAFPRPKVVDCLFGDRRTGGGGVVSIL